MRLKNRDEVVGGSQAACYSSYLRLVVICESQERTGERGQGEGQLKGKNDLGLVCIYTFCFCSI
jgi:hypothetical protein